MLIGSGVLSFQMRAQDMQYGVELDEFDPYFNYRATKYLYENGHEAYLNWNDELSWYPNGRDVSATSQNALHYIAASTYFIVDFWSDVDLYTYTIYFPAIVGSITVFVIFGLMRLVSNTRIAAMAAFFFAVSVPFIQRGTAGWFKSEPLGVFLGLLGLYLFVKFINHTQQEKRSGSRIIMFSILSGITIAFALSSWGGAIFFMIPIILWIMSFPITKKTNKIMFVGLVLFVISMALQSTMFDRSEALVFGVIASGTILAIGFTSSQHMLHVKFPAKKRKIYLLSLAVLVASISIVAASGSLHYLSGGTGERYLGALLPFSTSGDDLVNSVAEHQTPTFAHIFERTVFILLFAPVGLFVLLKNKIPTVDRTFILIISAVGTYVGLTYVRLELFMSLGLLMLSAIAVYYMFLKLGQQKKKPVMSYALVVVLLGSMIVPAVINWSIMMDRPPLIVYGATLQGRPTTAWLDALEWLKTDTPVGSKVMAWWDYGYWIETKGERVTFMDNAAFNSQSIKDYARVMTDPPETAIPELRKLGADYVLIYFMGNKIPIENNTSYVTLGGGADVSKMPWILKIAGKGDSMVDEHIRLTSEFYSDTLYGNMIPFTPYTDAIAGPSNIDITPWLTDKIDPRTDEPYGYGLLYYSPKYEKLHSLGLTLVYVSEEFKEPPSNDMFNAIMIYKVQR